MRVVPAMLLVSVAACSMGSQEEGLEVALELRAAQAPGAGGEIDLEQGFLTVAALELIPCPSAWTRARGLWLGTAHAHSPGSRTRLGVPVVLPIGGREPTRVGVLHPPPGHYCAVRWEIGPADRDAVGLDRAPGMAGLSVQVAGTFRDGVQRGFTATTSTTASGQTSLGDWNLAEPRPLGEPWILQISHLVPALLQGLSPGATSDDRGRHVLDNLPHALTAELL